MAVKTVEVRTCDICGKPRKELAHTVSIDGNEAQEVCEHCAKRVASLLQRIANPPKRAPKKTADSE